MTVTTIFYDARQMGQVDGFTAVQPSELGRASESLSGGDVFFRA